MLHEALDAAGGLALLRGVVDDEPGRAVRAVLATLADADPDPQAVAIAYSDAFAALAAVADDEPLPGIGDTWQAHLTARVVDDANPWSAQAERVGPDGLGEGMRAQARRELRALRRLFDLGADRLYTAARAAVVAARPALVDTWGHWYNLSSPDEGDGGDEARARLRRRLAETEDWATLDRDLAAYWARHGTGLVARYRALRWDGRAGTLCGIAHPDPIHLDDLVGYEREQGLLTSNAERFLAGLPAQDALLYGTPGTGKSSTVKAIANRYADRGLRLIEVRKEDMNDLPAIGALVRDRAPRFLLFIDDLSFEEHETEYKALKALLEGTAQARPSNLLIYVTSNRRNLIRETFADRGQPGDDVHGRDTMQEKISLAERFGLRVTFSAPDQTQYLRIATALARQRKLNLPPDEVQARALLWDRQHPGRSGRTARQFVDDLEAEMREKGTSGE